VLPQGAYQEQCGGGDVISKIVLIGGGEGGVLSDKERKEAQQWQVCRCFHLFSNFCTIVYFFAQGVHLDAFASIAEMEQIAESLSANRSSSISGSDDIGHNAHTLLQALLLMRLRAVNGPVGEFDCVCALWVFYVQVSFFDNATMHLL
jgi:hypothetical protein